MEQNTDLSLITSESNELAASARSNYANNYGRVDAAAFITELRRCKQEVDIARQQFDTVDDPLLIDHMVFRLGAAEKRFNYLFQLARQMEISVEGMRWEWYEQD